MSDNDSNVAEAERWWSFREKSIEFSKEYGVATVRYLILVNGGAIIALLALLGNFKTDSAIKIDIPCLKVAIFGYVLGLLCGGGTSAIGYLNFQKNALSVPDPDKLYEEVSEKKVRRVNTSINMTSQLALVVVTVGFVLFTLSTLLAVFSISLK